MLGQTGNAPLTITGKQVIKIDIYSLHNFNRAFFKHICLKEKRDMHHPFAGKQVADLVLWWWQWHTGRVRVYSF
jgi:hypothetical protein